MSQTLEFLGSIERPLRYLAKGGARQLRSVKNLSDHILEVSQKALAAGLAEGETRLFRSLQELFLGFEKLEDPEKKARIEKALVLISPKRSSSASRRVFLPEDHQLPTLERLKDAEKRLSRNVQYIKGVGPAIAAKFAKAGLRKVNDLLLFFPIRFEDRRTIARIGDLKDGMTATVVGTVEFAGVAFYRGLRKRVFEVTLEDGTGTLKLKWFHFPLGTFEERVKHGQQLIVNGKVRFFRSHLEMYHPDFEIYAGAMDSISFGKIVPIYSEVGGLYQKTLRRIMHRVVADSARDRICAMPSEICRRADLLPPWKAVLELHEPRQLPRDEASRSDAERSLAFEELFFYCLSLADRKRRLSERKGIAFTGESARLTKMRANLPFTLTGTQERILETIHQDMASAKPMNRLLQGDVGSGKTIVAFLAALLAIDHGYQVAFLAPTEILAEQHFKNLSQWAQTCDVRVSLIIGGQAAAERKAALEGIKSGRIHLVVGTHALLEGGVNFPSLGFVVVDEQHRFGVEQRATLRGKGFDPDVLVMSATPIPRTLALTLYGDLDVSIMNELPAGRKPIATRLFREAERETVYELVRKEIQAGRQAFMVYPLVNASEKIDLKDATTMASQLQKEVFPNLRLGLLHGQMPPSEKEALMHKFRAGELDILVATTVVEVGIDVPNATVMVIEHPERFGLSQLHQLRGRVGRGSERSSCYLIVPQGITRPARERLAIFSRVHDGFLLAEEDLRLRGPGDFFGLAQSGYPPFQVARFPRDLDVLEAARREAFALLEGDPRMKKPEHSHMPWLLTQVWAERIKLVHVG